MSQPEIVPITLNSTTAIYDHPVSQKLCTFCIQAATEMRSLVVVEQTKFDFRTRALILRSGTIPPGCIMPGTSRLSPYVVGNYGMFMDLANFFGDGPGIRWMINGETVRIFAEVNIFGLEICASHVDIGMTLWRGGQRWS